MCQAYAGEDTAEMSLTSFAGFLKRKSGLMIYERWSDISQILSAGKNSCKIAEYLQNQMKKDGSSDLLRLDLSAPFREASNEMHLPERCTS